MQGVGGRDLPEPPLALPRGYREEVGLDFTLQSNKMQPDQTKLAVVADIVERK